MEQTNQNQFKCSGNCLNCLPAQRAYCASQHAYSNMKVLDMLTKTVLDMQGEISIIKEKIEAIQNNEANVFATESEGLSENPSDIGRFIGNTAQSGDGAENRSPETI